MSEVLSRFIGGRVLGERDFLWAVGSVMLFSDFVVAATPVLKQGKVAHRRISLAVLATSTLAYTAMASRWSHLDARDPIPRDKPGHTTQAARYLQWLVNAPLLIVILFLNAGASPSHAFVTMFMADFAIIQHIVASLVPNPFKWGCFVVGLTALFFAFIQIILNAIRGADIDWSCGRPIGQHIFHAKVLTTLWIAYPMVWALFNLANLISPTAEAVAYGSLDVLCGPFFLWLVLRPRREPASKESKAGAQPCEPA
ncbi:family A G protein-coupled receptor-like protein [Auriscalpium vulgare]|uniref:Family A G protein-coupled receptor-like protein n=1 Tax=Auriscalpium vulgare TaxID=40419 RepID=A0ACB8SAL4_9AGAM|nr:family A G protein-coupled receptor-like protein [Auriscalpium vulgare]